MQGYRTRFPFTAPGFCSSLIPNLDLLVSRFGYRQIAFGVLLAAVFLSTVFAGLYFHLLTGSVPAYTMGVALFTAISAGSPIIIIMTAAIRRLDRMGRSVRDQARMLDQRNEALARAEEALRGCNETLETRVRERTDALRLALDDARRADSEKTMFLASMSHELRTPLNAIIGFSEMMANRRDIFGTAADERVDEYSGLIGQAGTHLLSLVNDLLDLARLECGQCDLSIKTLNVDALVSSTSRLFEQQLNQRGQSIETRIDPTASRIDADPRALQQILANLLSNALKFSPEGTPVSVAVTGDAAGTTITVADRGPGMTAMQARDAVRPFTRMSQEHVAAGESVGLGLPIVDALTRMHGGSLSFDLDRDIGTLARVHIPAPDRRGRSMRKSAG